LHTEPVPPLVEIWRGYDDQPWQGFLVARSDAVVVIHQVSDRLDLNGYTAFHSDDIESLEETFEERELLELSLQVRQQRPLVPRGLDAGSMKSLMDSAQQRYGILLIERELMAPEEVEVGAVRLASSASFVLRWMSELAEWGNDDRTMKYADITRIEFGDGYTQTLLAVAGLRGSR
jgi:hypothetical protein